MSDYYDDDRSRRRRSARTRDYSPEVVREETYISRGTREAPTSRELVYRGRDDDSVDDYRRDYVPRRARSARNRRESIFDRDDDGYSEDYGYGYRGRDQYDDDYDDRYPRRERRKSRVEEFADDIGLGGVVAAVTGAARSRSRHRGRGYESEGETYDRRGRARSKSRDTAKKWQQAATAAVLAGAVEAFRSRNSDGSFFSGDRGKRIATTALAAAGIDGLIDRDPEEKSKRHVLESVVGGLVTNRIANGPRSRSQSRGRGLSRSRSRGRSLSRVSSIFSRSKSRGGSQSPDGNGRSKSRGRLAALAAAGGVAAAGKAIYDRVRSKSRGRKDRDRSRSSSEDSYIPSRRQRYQGGRASRSRGDFTDEGSSYVDDDKVARPRGRGEVGAAAAGPGAEGERKRDQSTSSVSTTDLENQRKKQRGRELITAGLATVATIHAAHGVYSSMAASDKRHKAVMEGEMSPEQARKLKSKNMLQDAAAIGIAALGIKSAFTEWKEMREQRNSVKEIEAKRRKRRKAKERREREMHDLRDWRNSGYGTPWSPAAPYQGYPPYQPPVHGAAASYYQPSGPHANQYNSAVSPTSYQDGNPYGSGVPPPPMGPPSGARY